MITSLSHAQFSNDFFPVATETIMLSNTSTQWAKRVCHPIADTDEQWHSFLRALAIAGFEQWLNQGNTTLSITYPQNSAPQRDANIQVGDFQLCILPMGALKDDRVAIPAAVVTGENAAHLYVLVEVHEEVEQVRVLSGLRHDQLRQYLRQCGVEDNAGREATGGSGPQAPNFGGFESYPPQDWGARGASSQHGLFEKMSEGYVIPTSEFSVSPEKL